MGRSFDEILADVRSGKTATKTKTTTEKSGFDEILSRVRNRMKKDESAPSSAQIRGALGLSEDAYAPASPKQKTTDGSFVSDFLDRADRWFGSARHDLDNVKWATAADAYDRRSASLAGLTEQLEDVQGWITQNKGTLDADSYDQISRYLDGFGDNAKTVMDAFSNARDVYGKYGSQEEYDTAVRQDGYFKKYGGMTSQDIETTLGGMDDGEEKDWLTAYKGQVEYDEMLNYDLDLGSREVKELEGVLEEYDRLILQQSTQNPQSPANVRLQRIVATYGSKSQIEDMLARKKSYLTQAQRAREGVRLSSVADKDSEFYDPEFDALSGYVSTKKDGWWGKLTSEGNMGFGDLTYEYINGDEELREQIRRQTGRVSDSGAADTTEGENTSWLPYGHMNESEIAIYNYYYAKDGKEAAENYLSHIQDSLNARAADARFEGTLKGNTGLELLFSLEAGVDQFSSGIKNAFNFSDDYIPYSATQQLSGKVREDLKDDGFMLPAWMGGASVGQAAYDMGSTTANMLPSILVSLVPGAGQVLGTASMGISAAGNAYQEMLNLGYSKGQSRLYSALVGGSEAGLQYLLGGIGKLGGVADDAATKALLSHVDKALGRVAIQLGANALSEGFEEGLQEVLTPWFQNIAFGLEANVNWSDVLYSSLLGALTANLFEGGSVISENVGYYKAGKKLQADGINGDTLAQIGNKFSPDTVAYQLAGKVDASTGAYTIGRMFHEIGASMTEQNVRDITQNLISKGMRESDAGKLAKAIETTMNDPLAVTQKQMKVLDANDVLTAAVIEELIDPNTTYYQRQYGYEDMLRSLADSVVAERSPSASLADHEQIEAEANRRVNPFDHEAMAKKIAAQQALAAMRAETPAASVSGENASTGDIVMDAAMQVAQERAEAEAAEQEKIAQDSKQIVAEAYADIGSVTSNPVIVNMPQASRESLISGYDPASGVSAQEYVGGANMAYWYGYEGITLDEKALPKNSVVRYISKAQRESAYALGAKDRAATDAVSAESGKAVYQAAKEKLGDQAGAKRKGKVAFEDGLTESAVRNRKKRAGLALAKKVAEVTGIDIHVYSGAREYGFYKNGMVWLNINATMSGQDMMTFTVGHELCHAAREISPEKFKKFADYLLEKYGEMGKSVEELIRDKIQTCAESDYFINEHEAYEEVICDACQRMLLDTNALETMYEFRQAEPEFWEKIVNEIRKFIENIRKLFANADPGDMETELFKQMDEASKQMLANLYADMIMDTGDKIATIRAAFGDDVVFQTNENGEFTVARGEDANGTTKLMFNIATWENGGRDTLVEALRNEGYSAEDIKAAVAIMDGKQELVKRLGKQFPEQGRINKATLHTDIKDGHSVMSALVSNGDYPVNIDLLMVCKKRKAYQRVINRLCETGLIQQATLDALAIAEINKILGKYGFETACLGCFVESRRLRIQEWADTIVSEWNGEVKKRNPNAKAFGFGKGKATLTPDEVMTLVGELEGHEKNDKGNLNLGKGNSVQRMGRLMDKVPSLRKTLSVEDLITPEGLASLRRFDSNLFSMVKSRYGSNSPKFVQDFNPYNHELAMYGTVPSKYKSLREYLYAIGGARMQSFSDFIVENWFDYCQIVADLAARKLPMHTYTKEIALAKLFGMTGIKINMSLIPDIDRSLGKEFAGLTRDENGKLVLIWSDKDRYKATGGKSYMQSINFADAVALQNDPRYSGNIGTIAIGISDKQIEVMLDDSRIRMIIPYHASGMNPIFADLVGTSFYKDYTDFQNTTVKHLLDSKGNIRKVKLSKEQAAKLTSGFLFNEMLQELGDARAAAQAYLDWCADASQHTITIGGETYTAVLTPKFDAFSGHENYYKLLEDFNTYDCISGQAAPQGDVQQVYPEGFEDILEAELKAQEGHRQKQAANQAFDKAMAEIEAYLGEHTKADTVFYAEQHGIKLSAKDKKLGAEDKKKLAGLRKGAKMSVPKVVDSDGRQLSPEQQEFFRDSKVRDEQGRLMRLFHGTDNGGFTVFRGETYWFADKVTAETYANPDHGDDTAMLYEVYLNAKNPLVIDAYGYRATGILTDIFASDGGRKRIHHIDDIALYALDNGYDGLIVKNVKDYGPYIEERIGVESDNSLDTGTVYVVFKPDQIKNADNITPTSSPDIRYSMPKVKSDQNDTSYQEPAYQEWDVQTALYDALDHRDMGDDNLIKVGNMPRYITDKLGIEGDFYIYRNHAYENMVTGDRAKTDGRFNLKSHYHGLGIETMTDAVMALENPIMTIATKTKDGNPAVIMILPVDGKNKAPLYAVLSFYSDRKINGDLRKKPHIVLTIAEREFFGSENRSGYAEMVRDAVNDGRVIDYDKKTRGALSVIANQARVGDITEASLTESLAQFLKEIKSFKEKNRINYKTPNSRGMSSRQLLADAFEELIQSPKERALIEEYRANITKVEDVQERLKKLRGMIRELTNAKGDKARIAKMNQTAADLSALIDEYDRKLLELEASKPLRDVLARAKTAAYREARRISDENMTAYRKQVEERFHRGVEERRERAAVRKYRERIAGDVKELTGWILRPDSKNAVKRVPEVIRTAVVEFMESIDFTSKRQLDGKDPTQADRKYMKKLRALRDALKPSEPGALYSGYFDLPPDFMENLQKHIDRISELVGSGDGQYVINRMNSTELEALSSMVKSLKKFIKEMNLFHANAMYQHVYEAAEDSIGYMSGLKDAGKWTGSTSNFLMWQQMRPALAFERFGKGGVAVYDGLRRGMAQLAFNAKQIVDFSESVFSRKQVEDWEKDVKTIELENGETVSIPVSHIMSFYALSKRPQALQHLLGNGIRVATFKGKGGKTADNGHLLTMEDVGVIIAELTQEQKQVADSLQAFMADVGGKWGNAVSMRRFGEEMFGEKTYFPINSDGRHLQAVAEENPSGADLYALLNMSFTRELTEHANNRVMLYSVFDVFANHMASMAQYNALALPVLDAIKWLNYQQTEEVTDSSGKTKRVVHDSVREEMARAFGVPEEKQSGRGKRGYAESFVVNILKDFNGTQAHTPATDTTGTKLMQTYNRAQVAYNARVIVQQPTAILRAAMVLKYADIIRGIRVKPSQIKTNMEEMLRYSGVALWKDMGFFDVNISRGLTDMIKQDTSAVDRFNEFGMKGAEWADKLTWAGIWSACKEQVRASGKFADGSQAFFEETASVFEDVIYKTQVVDSILTKNEYLRSKGFFAKATSSFMAEPTTSFSLMAYQYDKFQREMAGGKSFQEAWKKHGKGVMRTMYVFSISSLVLAAIQAVADAWRDDDEYQDFLDKFREAFGGNLLDEAVPFNKLPLVNDVYDLAKELAGIFGADTYGNAPTSVWMQWFNQLVNGTKILVDKVTKKDTDYTWYGGAYKLMQAVSGISGLPLANLTREAVAIWNNTIAHLIPRYRLETYSMKDKSEIKYAFMDGYLDEAEALAALMDTRSVEDEAEGKRTVAHWRFISDNPQYEDISASALENYQQTCVPKGVDIASFYNAWKFKGKAESDKDADGKVISGSSAKDKVLEYIDELALSREQKDSLYLALGYGKTVIDEAPWN